MFNLVKKSDPDKENPPLTYWQKLKAERMAEQKKRVNVYLSRHSGEEAATGYQTSRSSFASGEVESRSRVSLVGGTNEGEVGRKAVGKVRNQLGFAKGRYGSTRTGFAKKSDYVSASGLPGNKPPTKPMGFGR